MKKEEMKSREILIAICFLILTFHVIAANLDSWTLEVEDYY